MVERDATKVFARKLPHWTFDTLLIDLIDERFNLWRTADSAYVTASSELSRTLSRPVEWSVISSGSEKFMALWEAGWARLCTILSKTEALGRVAVNQVYWSPVASDGRGYEPALSRQRIDAANDVLERFYRRMSNDIAPAQFLRFSSDLFIGDASHQWGRAPFHYGGAYREALLTQLRGFCARGA